MPAFHCNARYFLVTYAQCGELSEWSVLDRFAELGAECIIAREEHKDLGLHLHVFADFGRKFRSRTTSIFDVDGRHANIQPSRGTPEKGYDYAIKDGDIVAGGLERPSGRVGSGAAFDLWTQITDAEDRDAFWSLVQELDPKSLCCSFGQLQKYADWKYTPAPPVYATPGGFEFVGGDVDGRDAWVQAAGLGLGQPPLGKFKSPTPPSLPSVGTQGVEPRKELCLGFSNDGRVCRASIPYHPRGDPGTPSRLR